MPRKMMEGRKEGRVLVGGRKGRSRLKWMNDVVADLKVMKIKQWMERKKERNGD